MQHCGADGELWVRAEAAAGAIRQDDVVYSTKVPGRVECTELDNPSPPHELPL